MIQFRIRARNFFKILMATVTAQLTGYFIVQHFMKGNYFNLKNFILNFYLPFFGFYSSYGKFL